MFQASLFFRKSLKWFLSEHRETHASYPPEASSGASQKGTVTACKQKFTPPPMVDPNVFRGQLMPRVEHNRKTDLVMYCCYRMLSNEVLEIGLYDYYVDEDSQPRFAGKLFSNV